MARMLLTKTLPVKVVGQLLGGRRDGGVQGVEVGIEGSPRHFSRAKHILDDGVRAAFDADSQGRFQDPVPHSLALHFGGEGAVIESRIWRHWRFLHGPDEGLGTQTAGKA